MSWTVSLSHEYGTLTGYFGPPNQVIAALSDHLRPMARVMRWDTQKIAHSTPTGFHRASDIKNGILFKPLIHRASSSFSIRYIVTQNGFRRDLSPESYQTVICQSLKDLQNPGIFVGLTIIEDSVLLYCLEDTGPDKMGTLLRDMATGTRGVLILGQTWDLPLNQMEPYFNRVVFVHEIPPVVERSKGTKAVPGQATIC
ncbi:MAG TPA: hypothetical protein VN372_03350 [Methanospirillum sp.]|nr:hypothetical protein [Methanospirillum sp.]